MVVELNFKKDVNHNTRRLSNKIFRNILFEPVEDVLDSLEVIKEAVLREAELMKRVNDFYYGDVEEKGICD